jgi:dynein intermediate chain 1
MAPGKHGKAAKVAGKKGKDKPEDAAPVAAPKVTEAAEEEDVYHEPIKRIVKPDSQLELDEKQMEEEHTRVLTANDPNVPNNIIKYNYKDKAYKQDPEVRG